MDTFPDRGGCVRYYGTTGPGSLAKGDKGCTRAKLPLLLAEYLIFFLPSRQPLEPLSETTFKPGRFVVRFSSSRNLSLFLFVFVFVERKRGKSDTYDRLGHFSLYVDSMIFLVPSWIYGQRETRSISRVQRALGANSFEYRE